MKSFSEIVKAYTFSEFSEIPMAVVEHFKSVFQKRMFDASGYVRKDIPKFDAILEFLARYEIATMTDEQAKVHEAFANEMIGKKFRKPKGLLLFGNCGTGKTLASRMIADRFGLTWIDTYTIGLTYQMKDGNDWLANWLFKNSREAIVIDDIGAEGDIRRFGNENPIGAIIATRARYWEMYGSPTIYTSNSDSVAMIAEQYNNNTRLADRLQSYYIDVHFKGTSMRK